MVDNINFLLDVGQGRSQTIISYNQVLNDLEKENQDDETLYKFRALHQHWIMFHAIVNIIQHSKMNTEHLFQVDYDNIVGPEVRCNHEQHSLTVNMMYS